MKLGSSGGSCDGDEPMTCYIPTHGGYGGPSTLQQQLEERFADPPTASSKRPPYRKIQHAIPALSVAGPESVAPFGYAESMHPSETLYFDGGYLTDAPTSLYQKQENKGRGSTAKIATAYSFRRRMSVVNRTPSELLEDMEPRRLQRALVRLLQRAEEEQGSAPLASSSPENASKNPLDVNNIHINVADIFSEYVASAHNSSNATPQGSEPMMQECPASSEPSILPTSQEAWTPRIAPTPFGSTANLMNRPSTGGGTNFSALLGNRDWSREWQKVRTQVQELEAMREKVNMSPLESDSEMLDTLTSAEKLMEDFFYAAKAYARIIISEFALPDDQKTIPRANLGGIAGGEKFICKGILFKFAHDKIIASHKGQPLWMYGGDHCEDRLAIKAAAKELLGLETFVAQNSDPSLCFALMALVDYKGFRLIATSLLPIDSNTIVYGSNDGGNTIHTDDPEVNVKVERLAARMHIKGHFVGISKAKAKLLHAPGDFEVHRGKDGLLYALDFGRFLPPEAPCQDPQFANRPEERRSVFYKFLRPELSLFHNKSLSPDAFSAWTSLDPAREQNEQDLREVTEKLYREIIPTFAKEFQEQPLRFDVDLVTLLENICLRLRLVARARFMGINMRHLGRVRKEITSEDHRKLVLSNCVSRVIKNLIREEMRMTMKTSMGTPTDLPFRKVVVRMINIVLGRSGSLSTQFWNFEIKEHLQTMFHYVLSEEETAPDFDLRTRVDLRLVIFFLSSSLGIVFTSDAFKELMTNIDQFEMLVSDISELIPTARRMFFNYTYASKRMRLAAQQTVNTHAGRRLLYSAHNVCTVGSMLAPRCPVHCLEFSYLSSVILKHKIAAYQKEPTEAYHDLIEAQFETAFVQTEKSLASYLTHANLTQWASLGEWFVDWKRSMGEVAIAEEFEKKVEHLRTRIPALLKSQQEYREKDKDKETETDYEPAMEIAQKLSHFRVSLKIRHSAFVLPAERSPFTSVCGLSVEDFLSFSRFLG